MLFDRAETPDLVHHSYAVGGEAAGEIAVMDHLHLDYSRRE